MRWITLFVSGLLLLQTLIVRADDWTLAEENGKQSQRMIKFCNAYVRGWLGHADRRSGLLPRRVTDAAERYWNAKDCAADNFPFIALTGEVTDHYFTRRTARHILEQEQKLCNRLGPLPDDFDFVTQGFRQRNIDLDRLIFGASEYCKDGLMPISEWVGPSPWLDRMQELVRGIWQHAAVESPVGLLPSRHVEVNGELMQTLSRLYWLTGDESYKEWCFQLLDYYFLHEPLLAGERLPLRDHGCEIIAGLSEAYLVATHEDRERWTRYKPQMHALLDAILEHGVNEDGLMYNWAHPATGKTSGNFSDSWGYAYNAFLTVGNADGEKRYRQAVEHALSNLHKYRGYAWEGQSVDGYADSIEGAINLLSRIPVASAFEWVDSEVEFILSRQRDDGIIEGWYGDGNSARTLMMVALWKSQGITLSPWREDLQFGAAAGDDGSVLISLTSDLPWVGSLRFDRPRHRQYFHMPVDYARINQFPEWFTVELGGSYEVRTEGGEAVTVAGKALLDYPVTLDAGESLRLTVRRTGGGLRTMRYSTRSAPEAVAWQRDVRTRLFEAMAMSDQLDARASFNTELVSETSKNGYLYRELTINSTPGRQLDVVLTIPTAGEGPYPSVVCIHGHGGDRFSVYDTRSIYRGFAESLAKRRAITISIDVGQHEVQEAGRTLMGERLWALMRCVDYLESLPEADPRRIGCAGLSLGGEMAMWLGAMDERVVATVSSGYLTTMDQMEVSHCMCWKFPGLREVVDWADVYSLIAPRALLCQNGLQEPLTDFNVSLARQASREIELIYHDLGKQEKVGLRIHDAGHVIDLESLLTFFQRHLGTSE